MRHRYRVSQSKNPFVSAIWDKMSILQDVSFLLAIIINLLILLGYGTLLDPQTPLPLNSRCVRCEDQYCAGYTLTNRRAFSVTALTSWWIPLWWPTLHLGVTEPMSRYGVYPPPHTHKRVSSTSLLLHRVLGAIQTATALLILFLFFVNFGKIAVLEGCVCSACTVVQIIFDVMIP